MRRYCFYQQIRPELLDHYVERHREVWPDLLRALKATGWHNFSIHLREDGLLVGYVESPDIEAAQAAMAELEVNEQWQREMVPFFDSIDAPPDESFLYLREVFHLETQLAALDDRPDRAD
jgi:L-rhamnose mutarotase